MVIKSGIGLIPDGFCFLDPLEELSIIGPVTSSYTDKLDLSLEENKKKSL